MKALADKIKALAGGARTAEVTVTFDREGTIYTTTIDHERVGESRTLEGSFEEARKAA